MEPTSRTTLNGIDAAAFRRAIQAIAADPAKGVASFRVVTQWRGGTRSETSVDGFGLGGETVRRSFRFEADEPVPLSGTDAAPNPQELLLGALNACMTVGWVVSAALRGIRLDALEIETEARLDLRGFLAIDRSAAPGHESIAYRVRVRGDGTPAEFAEIHEAVRRTSPNWFSLSRPIVLEGELSVG